MADQDRCPECGGDGSVLADGVDFGRQHMMPCGTCGGTGRKPVMANMSSADSPADKPPISPDLPDEVLDRAVDAGYSASWSTLRVPARGTPTNRTLRKQIAGAAPVLVEHGRRQERDRATKAVLAVMYREEADTGNPAQTGNPPYTAHDEAILAAVGDWHDAPTEPFEEAEARGAAAERDRIRAWVEREEQRLIKLDQSGGYDGDDYEPIERREGMQITLDRLLAALDREVDG